jgi:bifunctional non-homologous end joining protein LigD
MRDVHVSSLDRVLWPEARFTKAHLLDYVVRVAPVLLPHLRGRPLTLHRFPEGYGGPHFFQTRTPPHPDWVRTQRMWTFTSGKEVDAPVIDDVDGLVWAVNLSTLELHPYLSCAERLDRPDFVVFDLDPGPPAGLLDACALALELHALLDGLGLTSLVKTSGGKGVHVYVPVAAGAHTYDDTKAFARAVASLLARRSPERVVDRMPTALRAGKVFVDWSQNDPGKSTVVAYSTRAIVPVPTVSTPVTWDEVRAAVDAASPDRLWFGPDDVLDRVREHGDLCAGALTGEQTLPGLRG